MSDYVKCPICREYGWLGSHRCPPMWEARMLTTWFDDWSKVRGTDAQEAAAKFAEQRDQNGDYDIIRHGSAEVEVRKAPGFEMDDEEIAAIPVQVFDIEAESVPHYSAWERPTKADEPSIPAKALGATDK